MERGRGHVAPAGGKTLLDRGGGGGAGGVGADAAPLQQDRPFGAGLHQPGDRLPLLLLHPAVPAGPDPLSPGT